MKNAMKGADRGRSSFMENTKHLIEKLKKRNIKDKKIGLSPNTKKTQEEAAIELLESWLLMKYLCDRMGSKFLCILQPNGFTGEPDLKHILDFHWEERREFFDYYEVVKDLIETPRYAELKEHFIDMTSAFDHMPLVYIDFSHVGPKGNEVIAGLLLDSIEGRDWFKER